MVMSFLTTRMQKRAAIVVIGASAVFAANPFGLFAGLASTPIAGWTIAQILGWAGIVLATILFQRV